MRVTHGPLLGRPGPDTMSLWVRTEKSRQGNRLLRNEERSFGHQASLVTTDLAKDRTGIITLQKLTSNTRYYYRIADHQLDGSFRTLPTRPTFMNPDGNPDGLFNFKFEFACGNNQNGNGNSAGPTVPVFDTLNAKVRDEVHFAILNGDWLYEQRRDYPPEVLAASGGIDSMKEAPRVVRKAPSIVGVWETIRFFLKGEKPQRMAPSCSEFLHCGRP